MRVLIVEDEKKVAAAVRRGLEAEGFAVYVALTGTDGLWMATENAYDIIVLDIMLPGMNGYKVCENLREAGNWTPILMLTAKDGEYDHAEALDTGADDFLDEAVLVRGAVGPGARTAPAYRAVAADRGHRGRSDRRPADASMPFGDVDVALTAREFAVLEFLMRDVPARSSRSPRSSTMCGTSPSRATRTSSRCTSATSGRKLDEPFDRQLIETIRWRRLPAGSRRRLTIVRRLATVRVRVTLAAVVVVGSCARGRRGVVGGCAA